MNCTGGVPDYRENRLWMCSATYSKTSAGIRHRKFHDTATPHETMLLTTMCCCRLQAKPTFMVIGPRKIAPSRDTAVLKTRLNLARSWNFSKSSFAGKISIAKRSRCWNVKIRINFHIVRHTGIYRPRRWWRFLRTWWKDHVLESEQKGRGRLENVSTVSYLWVESAAWSGVGVHANSGSLFVVCRGRRLSSSNRVTTC